MSNPVLERIERELSSGISRVHGRRRRRRTLAVLAVGVLAALLVAGGGIAAVTSAPIERLLSSDTPFAKRAHAPRIDLRQTDAGGLGWTVTMYVSTRGMVSSTSAPDGLAARWPAVGGASGFVIADNLLNGPVAGEGLDVVRVRSDGRRHYLFSGSVDARARRVVIDLGGERQTATLSTGAITVPVDIDWSHLTAIGRDRAARMPAHVSVRAYAATLTPDLLAGRKVVRGWIETTLADGTHHRQRTARFCVAGSCGGRPVEVE